MALYWPDMLLRSAREIDLANIDQELFWSKVIKFENGCWIWKSKLDTYGSFRGFPSHRVAYVIAHGSIPAGLVVAHKCDTKGCCNPSHLEAITHGQNTRDAINRGLRPANRYTARAAS